MAPKTLRKGLHSPNDKGRPSWSPPTRPSSPPLLNRELLEVVKDFTTLPASSKVTSPQFPSQLLWCIDKPPLAQNAGTQSTSQKKGSPNLPDVSNQRHLPANVIGLLSSELGNYYRSPLTSNKLTPGFSPGKFSSNSKVSSLLSSDAISSNPSTTTSPSVHAQAYLSSVSPNTTAPSGQRKPFLEGRNFPEDTVNQHGGDATKKGVYLNGRPVCIEEFQSQYSEILAMVPTYNYDEVLKSSDTSPFGSLIGGKTFFGHAKSGYYKSAVALSKKQAVVAKPAGKKSEKAGGSPLLTFTIPGVAQLPANQKGSNLNQGKTKTTRTKDTDKDDWQKCVLEDIQKSTKARNVQSRIRLNSIVHTEADSGPIPPYRDQILQKLTILRRSKDRYGDFCTKMEEARKQKWKSSIQQCGHYYLRENRQYCAKYSYESESERLLVRSQQRQSRQELVLLQRVEREQKKYEEMVADVERRSRRAQGLGSEQQQHQQQQPSQLVDSSQSVAPPFEEFVGALELIQHPSPVPAEAENLRTPPSPSNEDFESSNSEDVGMQEESKHRNQVVEPDSVERQEAVESRVEVTSEGGDSPSAVPTVSFSLSLPQNADSAPPDPVADSFATLDYSLVSSISVPQDDDNLLYEVSGDDGSGNDIEEPSIMATLSPERAAYLRTMLFSVFTYVALGHTSIQAALTARPVHKIKLDTNFHEFMAETRKGSVFMDEGLTMLGLLNQQKLPATASSSASVTSTTTTTVSSSASLTVVTTVTAASTGAASKFNVEDSNNVVSTGVSANAITSPIPSSRRSSGQQLST